LRRFNFTIGKNRKYLLIAGALLLLFALIYRALPLIQDLWPTDDEIALKNKHLAKYRQIVGEKDAVETRLAALKKNVKQGESGLLRGKTPALVAADIQKILHDLAKKSKVEIKRVRVLKAVELEQSDYLSVPVQLNINADIRQLKEILYRIEASQKYLTVKKMKIKVITRRRGKQGLINSDITVHGFLKKAKNQDGRQEGVS